MKNIIVYCIVIVTLVSCSKGNYVEDDKDALSIYEEFWQHVDENYIYFDEKGVDWKQVYTSHANLLSNETNDEELLQIMESSLLELRDAHNLIRTPFRQSLTHDFRAGYDLTLDTGLIERKYLDSTYEYERSFAYGTMNSGRSLYIYVPKMEFIKSLKSILRNAVSQDIKEIIIDVRNNGGGNSNDVPELLEDFVVEKRKLGNYIEKNGPLHNDVTLPLPIYAEPSDIYHDVDVYLLINRGGYSATSYLAAMCMGLPNFTLIGEPTGGGGGGNAGFELSNGWTLAISVSDFTDKQGLTIELGVKPDIEIANSPDFIVQEIDPLLEKVMEMIGK